MANLELALSHFREAARIYRATNHVEDAETALRDIAETEETIRRVRVARAAVATRG